MRQLSSAGQQTINEISRRHGFSFDAVLSMLESVINGNGSMAQFCHSEFAGSGQWMRGGMIMVSDMFNSGLKGRIDALCDELSNLILNQPDLIRTGTFQSQSQGGQDLDSYQSSQRQNSYGGGQQQQQGTSGPVGQVSLFVPPASGTSGDWWPGNLRWPNSTGAQNGVRYAYFEQAQRLAIEINGHVTVYDTLDHKITGFSQQQSLGGSLSFNSQHGLIHVASLPIVSLEGAIKEGSKPASFVSELAPQNDSQAPAMTQAPGTKGDVFATLEKLAELRAKGVVSDQDFADKKAELLSRL